MPESIYVCVHMYVNILIRKKHNFEPYEMRYLKNLNWK